MKKMKLFKYFAFTLTFSLFFSFGCRHVQNFSKKNRAHKISKRQIKLICSIYNREKTSEISAAYHDLANCKDHMDYIKRNKEREHYHLYSALMQILGPPFKSDAQEKIHNAIDDTYDHELESFSLHSDLEDVYDEIYEEVCDECSFRSSQEKAVLSHQSQSSQTSHYFNKKQPSSGSYHSSGCNLGNYKQRKPMLQGCQLAGGQFFAVDFGGHHLDKANLNGASFENAHIENSFLLDVFAEGTNFHGANLNGVDLSRARLTKANLQYTKMTGTKLRQADSSFADLTHTRMEKVDARKAVFKGAVLVAAKLRHSNFEGANFVGADLTEADVEGSSFKDADFSKAKLNKVKGMVESCPEEMPDSYECDKDKKNSFIKD